MNTTLQKKQRRILTPTETEKFNEAISEDVKDQKETEFTFPGPSRMNVVNEQLGRIKKTLKEGQAEPLSKSEKQARERRIVTLKAWLQRNMVPKSHVRLRSQSGGVQDPEFRKAVNDMAKREMSPEFQQVAQEYKNIMRELERPEDANLEEIRPDTR
jgi:hypothetical protein